MAVNNGIITAPINISDPYVCMGVGKYNGWWDLGYIASNQHKKINPFSLRKPVRYSKPNTSGDPEWFKGDMGDNYGFELIGGTSLVTSLPAFGTTDGISKFVYNPPGSGEWKRLNDFEGYNHYALAPLQLQIGQLLNSDGLSYYRLYYSQEDADIPFSEFFKYNPSSATNPEYRLAFIYRTKTTLPSNYQFILSPSSAKWGNTNHYQMDISSWETDAGKDVELSVYMTTVTENKVASNVESTNLEKITPLIPLIFEGAGDRINYLSTFKNAEKAVEPITITEIELLANKASAPATWVTTFRIYFTSTKGDSQTLNLSQYYFNMYCGSWGGYFKLLDGQVKNTLEFQDVSGSATASGTGVSSVVAKFTYSNQPVANYLMYSFTAESNDSSGYPKGDVMVSLKRKSDNKTMISSDLDYHNYTPITIS